MKKSVSVSVESEKLSALNMFLEQKNLKLSDELAKQIDVLYTKYVPKNIRDFIEVKSAGTSDRKPKKVDNTDSEKHSEQ